MSEKGQEMPRIQEQVEHGRHGVEVGSWWIYRDEGGIRQVILRVESWSYYGSTRGSLELWPHVAMFKEECDNLVWLDYTKQLLREIDDIDVVRFWELIDVGTIKRIDFPAGS